MTTKIQFPGLKDAGISPAIQLRIKEYTEKQAEKLQHHFHNEYELIVHMRGHEQDGNRSRYEAQTRLTFPGDTIAADADNWDALTAARDSLDKLEEQLKNKFHDD